MASGPQQLTVSTANLLKYAEATIDAAINQAKFYPVCVPTDALGIGYVEFNSTLSPKYLKAGWRIVEWRLDGNNNRWYVFLSM